MRKEDRVSYWIKSLADPAKPEFKKHICNLHVMKGEIPRDQLVAEVSKMDEYIVEKIIRHWMNPEKGLQFRVKWRRYPDRSDNDLDSWIQWTVN